MKKLFIRTFGCQMNDYDSAHIVNLLQKVDNVELTTTDTEADILILNTCSVRDKAQEKIFHQLGRWKNFKQHKPNIIIGVGGCVASQEGSSILKRAPFVDMIFGPQTIHRLPNMLVEVENSKKSVVDISYPAIEKFDNLPALKVDGYTANVTIMEGCSKYCSFCIVPYTRGEEISRPVADVMREVEYLVDQGVQEITFLGQNVNSYYGKISDNDLSSGSVLDNDYGDLAYLIALTDKIDKVKRIRFTTSNPISFNDSLVNAYARSSKLVNHLHLPVQSGSDKILAAMKRNHTVLEYKSIIKKLRKVRPDISISSDFIIGFPGETEDDFQQTLKLVDAIGFDNSFSFIYSKRPGTPAAYLDDDVTLDIKKSRLQILQQLLRCKADKISHFMVGTQQTILVTGKAKKYSVQLQGRTENNRVVNFSSSDASLVGKLVNIDITATGTNCLLGKLDVTILDNDITSM